MFCTIQIVIKHTKAGYATYEFQTVQLRLCWLLKQDHEQTEKTNWRQRQLLSAVRWIHKSHIAFVGLTKLCKTIEVILLARLFIWVLKSFCCWYQNSFSVKVQNNPLTGDNDHSTLLLKVKWKIHPSLSLFLQED
jgi:hypothetical protein